MPSAVSATHGCPHCQRAIDRSGPQRERRPGSDWLDHWHSTATATLRGGLPFPLGVYTRLRLSGAAARSGGLGSPRVRPRRLSRPEMQVEPAFRHYSCRVGRGRRGAADLGTADGELLAAEREVPDLRVVDADRHPLGRLNVMPGPEPPESSPVTARIVVRCPCRSQDRRDSACLSSLAAVFSQRVLTPSSVDRIGRTLLNVRQ